MANVSRSISKPVGFFTAPRARMGRVSPILAHATLANAEGKAHLKGT